MIIYLFCVLLWANTASPADGGGLNYYQLSYRWEREQGKPRPQRYFKSNIGRKTTHSVLYTLAEDVLSLDEWEAILTEENLDDYDREDFIPCITLALDENDKVVRVIVVTCFYDERYFRIVPLDETSATVYERCNQKYKRITYRTEESGHTIYELTDLEKIGAHLLLTGYSMNADGAPDICAEWEHEFKKAFFRLCCCTARPRRTSDDSGDRVKNGYKQL